VKEERWRVEKCLAFSKEAQTLKLSERSQGPGKYILASYCLKLGKMIIQGSARPAKIGIFLIGKRIFQEEQPLDID
jgi:hypothetical protein